MVILDYQQKKQIKYKILKLNIWAPVIEFGLLKSLKGRGYSRRFAAALLS
jgi:hypothetical protein